MFRKKRYKSKRRFHRALVKQERLDKKFREDLKPNDSFQTSGIAVKVHLTRAFSGRTECYFEFGRLETDRKKFFFKQVFAEHDLADLIQAVREAQQYCETQRTDNLGTSRGRSDQRSGKRR